MHKFKKMTEIVDAMPSGEDKTAMKSLLKQIEKLDNAQSAYDAMSDEKHEGLPASIRQFFGENVLDDFDADIPFD